MSLNLKDIAGSTAEAENRPLEYDPKERARYIRTMIDNISKWMADNESVETITERAGDFIKFYPQLFKKMVSSKDITPINSMLVMLDKMGQGDLTQHQASIIVGKKLVDRYVTPQIQPSP
jgi:hypothetical protein